MRSIQLSAQRIALIGDPHSTPALGGIIRSAAEAGATAAFILGDIELRASRMSRHRLAELDIAAEEAGLVVHLLLGNHDNFVLADELSDSPAHSGPQFLGEFVRFLPHREASLIDVSTPTVTRRILAVPGAADFYPPAVASWKRGRAMRTMPPKLTSWTAAEIADRTVDLLLSHDAPRALETSAVAGLRAKSSSRRSPAEIADIEESADRVDAYYRAAVPALAVHGHMHLAGDLTDPEAGRRVISLSRADRTGGAIILGLESLTAMPLAPPTFS